METPTPTADPLDAIRAACSGVGLGWAVVFMVCLRSGVRG